MGHNERKIRYDLNAALWFDEKNKKSWKGLKESGP